MGKDAYVVAIIVAGTQEEAEKIGKTLVEERLAASANIIPGLTSFFVWKKEFHHVSETMVLLNTKMDCFEKLQKRAKELHSYELPEIIALPILAGASDFFAWIKENTG